MRAWCLPVLLLTFAAGPAWAHDADIVYAQLTAGKTPGELFETLTLTPATLQLLAPLDADGDGLLTQGDLDRKAAALAAGVWDEMPLTAAGQPCVRAEARAVLHEGFIELTAQLRCGPGELRQDFRFLRVLPPNYRVVLGTQLDGDRAGKRFAQGSMTSLTLPQPADPSAFDFDRVRAGFDDGVRRGMSLLALAACLAIFLGLKDWKRGAMALGLAVAALVAGGQVEGGSLAPVLVSALLIIGCAVTQPPPWPLIAVLALALGAWSGGGRSAGLGLALGTVSVWVVVAPMALAVGRMLSRRPRAWAVGRWAPVALGVVGAAFVLARVW
ncbi:MAG: hypothetical protein U0228_13495 [Myxococcaceae bacterium]